MDRFNTGISQHRRGFTLMETLLVVGILAVLVTISITSIVVIRKNMRFRACNDNACAIYMAAQSSLTHMRSMGQLHLLEEAAASDDAAAFGGNCVYAYSKGTGSSYDLMVPASLDAHIRNQQVIIEYHPKTGIVYSVFYYEGADSLPEIYKHHTSLREDEDLRRDIALGYYTIGDVDAINNEDFTLYQVSADISYSNADEGILTVSVPVKDQKGFDIFTNVDPYRYIAGRLEILLTISGQHGGQFTKAYAVTDETGTPILDFSADNARYKLHVDIPLDSLTESFANLGLQMIEGTLQNPIAAGDNISVTADLTFSPAADDPILIINSATIADINPMYHSLVENPEYDSNASDLRPYILTLSNGRHLQNLSYLDADFAREIASIIFTQENKEEDFVLHWYEDVDFTPISLPHIPKIDGNGVVIRNLSIDTSAGVMVEGSTQRYAGLFAALDHVVIENITLADSTINTADATATGGLIGLARDVTMDHCHVTDFSLTGSGNVGGLIGSAQNSEISNCTAGATVTGGKNAISHVGGLLGSSLDTAITSCVVQNATISSGSDSGTDNSKNALGGLVGHASNSGRNTDFAITACEVKNTVTVTGVMNSLSNLGGMVGCAKNTYFSECKSSAMVQGQGTTGSIPNNNLGGFVGQSENSRYAVTDVVLDYMPQYAEDAGGFAGVLSGDSVENLDVIFTSNPNAKNTLTNFGGIASIHSSGTINRASITSTNPQGTPEARFNQAANTAGFVVTNTGSIRRSFSNVTMDGGFCFVKNNTAPGTVRNCYGWAWGNDNTYELDGCTQSYFVNGNSGKVWLYDEEGAVSGRFPDTGSLADEIAVPLLNSGEDAPWLKDAATGYPYPVLKDVVQRGRHAAPVTTPYPYALRYVETYPEGTGDLIVIFDSEQRIIDILDNLKNESIDSTAYYLYHRTGSNLSTGNLLDTFDSDSKVFQAGWETMDELKIVASAELFTAYQLPEDTSFDSLNFQTYYPLYDADSFRIRTGQQFRNITQNPEGTFHLDQDITVTATVPSFSGTLHGNDHIISAQVPLFGTVGNDAVMENCHIETDGVSQPFGDLPGENFQATHWTATAQSTAQVDSFDSIFHAAEGTPRSITISLPGCTINGESALVTRYYYTVDTGSTQRVPGDSVSLELAEIQGLTYGELTAGNYYVKSPDSNSFLPLTVTSAEDGGLILTADNLYLEKSPDVLDTPVEISLYTISGSTPGSITGSCCLIINQNYLSSTGELLNALPEDTSCIWTVNADGSYSNSGVTLTSEDILTSQNFSGKFTVQKINHIYPCDYIGTASVVPGS